MLSDTLERQHADLLLSHFDGFLLAYVKTLIPYVQGQLLPETGTMDIEYAYLSIKSWLLLLHKLSDLTGDQGELTLKIWNELWPPFQSLLHILWQEAGRDEVLVRLCLSRFLACAQP